MFPAFPLQEEAAAAGSINDESFYTGAAVGGMDGKLGERWLVPRTRSV